MLNPKYAAGWKKVGDQSVPNWDNAQAGTIFEQLLTAAGGKVDGVLAANDGLGNAAITVLKKNGLQVPVTGQDATVQGLQNILAGDQCMTVYKPITLEADAAGAAGDRAAQGRAGQDQRHDARRHGQPRRPVAAADPDRGHQGQRQGRPSPTASWTKADLCTPAACATECTAAGIS